MMTPKGLQIVSSDDSLTRLRVIADGIAVVNIVFRIYISDCGRVPVRVQGFTYLLLMHRIAPVMCGSR